MTEKPQSKKKIYQIAKELNISHETLMDYLKKKGHEVKSHMSLVDDAMTHDIMSHFKKDKEVAEKHQRKIQTIRDSRKKSEVKSASAEETAKAKGAKSTKTSDAPVAEPSITVGKTPVPVETEVEETTPVEEKISGVSAPQIRGKSIGGR